MKCDFCGRESEVKGQTHCKGCGAKYEEPEQAAWKSEPFFYNGYICYQLREQEADVYEVQFWLGRELIERIRISRDVLRYHVKEYCDPMPFFWDLFLLAHGEKDVLKWKEKNTRLPAMFEIRRIENPEKERLSNLSLRDLALEVCRQ